VKDLKIPPCGLENTITLDVGQYMEGFSQASRRFSLLASTFLFKKLAPTVINELYLNFEESQVKAGDTIIEFEEHADRFCILGY
jgi:hypothetical protein